MLYLRCKAIIAVHDAHYNNRVRCPFCFEKGVEHYLDFPRGLKAHVRENYIFDCPECGCSFTWSEFRKSHSRRQLNIGGAGVMPAMQNQGVGTMLLQHIIEAMRAKGYDGMRFTACKKNLPALALYDKNGFEKCGEVFRFSRENCCYQMQFNT